MEKRELAVRELFIETLKFNEGAKLSAMAEGLREFLFYYDFNFKTLNDIEHTLIVYSEFDFEHYLLLKKELSEKIELTKKNYSIVKSMTADEFIKLSDKLNDFYLNSDEMKNDNNMFILYHFINGLCLDGDIENFIMLAIFDEIEKIN